MADEEKPTGEKNTQSAAASELSRYFVTVPKDKQTTVSDPVTKRLSWSGVGEHMEYEATVAHLDVVDDTGALEGKMFSITYEKLDDSGNVMADRPVTFCFNGGPGCASVPINFGGMGPKRVETHGVKHLSSAAKAVDNPHTLLKHTDLVFLDALGTGYSTLADGADAEAIFGIDGDADAFCRAITQWLEEHHRWQSPVYLFGESYGTVRNAALMRLMGERGVKLTGVTMLSAIWNWVQVQPGEDLYYLGMLPTYAAAAQFFGKAGQNQDVDTWFDMAMDWTEDVLAPALLKGDRLEKDRELEIAQEMSEFIGLDEKFIARRHLRVSLDDVRRELLADEGRVCGRLDMRFSSDAPSYAQDSSEWFAGEDAADDAVNAVWNTAFRTFLSNMGYKAPARYLDNNYYRVGVKWRWAHEEPGTGGAATAPNVTVDIACALRRDPTIKLAVLGGRYDAATTYWNNVFELSRQFLSNELKDRVVFHRYGCGHMAYVDEPTLERMDKDMEAFYQAE
ncbi:MAG: S10 family peptidase [Atopobiaceae bacterium]|jgi:carboxypeptidase C (cathepsin A)